jgi:hypothetical protein
MSSSRSTSRSWPIIIFALFNKNPGHPSLGFRKKGGVYTAEIGRRYRALARERKGDYY